MLVPVAQAFRLRKATPARMPVPHPAPIRVPVPHFREMTMKKMVFVAVIFAGASPAFANDDAEKLIGEMLKTVEDLGTQLKKVTDKDSAEAALPKVKELTKQFSGLKTKSDKLKLDPDTESRLLKQYEKKLFDAGEKVGQELKRLRQVDPAREVVAEVEKFVALLGNTANEKKK
jgi:hypothetical protein